jgi:transposase
MQGRHQFQDRKVLEFCLSEHIPEHNLYKRLKRVLKLEFIHDLTKGYYGSCGQKSIDATVFFKLCLIQHLENIDSDRKLLEICKLRLDLLYFLGYNLGDELPCHSTLCRTRALLPPQLFEQVFSHILILISCSPRVGRFPMFDDDVYGRISAGIPKKDSLVVEKLSNGDTASIGRYAITKEGDLSDLKTGRCSSFVCQSIFQNIISTKDLSGYLSWSLFMI